MSAIANKDDFRQTTLAELRKLPIPVIDDKAQEYIIKRVEKIISVKRQNSENDTSDLEKEIDEHVYKLYNLSIEQIGSIV